RSVAAICLQFQPSLGGDVHGRRGGPRVEGYRVVSRVPLDVELHARLPGQVVAVEVGREGVVAAAELGAEVEAPCEVATRSRARVANGVVPRPGIDADTLNAGGGGRGDAIAGDDHAGGTVIDDGHVVVRSVADDAERVAGHRDRTARAPAAFEFFQAQNCMPVSGAMNPCDGMPQHVVSPKKEEREGTMPSLA